MPRPTARSRRRDRVFFIALENGHSIGHACTAAGYARASVYEWRRSDTDFAERWLLAKDAAGDLLENEADRRARDGTDMPVFYAGEQVGTKRKFSDALLLARLKAERPEKYSDRALPAPSHEPRERFVVIRDFDVEDVVLRLLADGRLNEHELPERMLERINAGRKEAGRTIEGTLAPPCSAPTGYRRLTRLAATSLPLLSAVTSAKGGMVGFDDRGAKPGSQFQAPSPNGPASVSRFAVRFQTAAACQKAHSRPRSRTPKRTPRFLSGSSVLEARGAAFRLADLALSEQSSKRGTQRNKQGLLAFLLSHGVQQVSRCRRPAMNSRCAWYLMDLLGQGFRASRFAPNNRAAR